MQASSWQWNHSTQHAVPIVLDCEPELQNWDWTATVILCFTRYRYVRFFLFCYLVRLFCVWLCTIFIILTSRCDWIRLSSASFIQTSNGGERLNRSNCCRCQVVLIDRFRGYKEISFFSFLVCVHLVTVGWIQFEFFVIVIWDWVDCCKVFISLFRPVFG